VLPGVVVAHSELETSDPVDGATLTTPPATITGIFTEGVDPARSSLELRGPDGTRIATGGVPADGPATRMTIPDLPDLAPGTYEVRWTTITADDDGVERGTFSFTVEEATPGPALTPPPAAASPRTSAVPGSAAPAMTPAPAASPAPAPGPELGATDVLIPILALGVVLLGGAALFLRRRR
jgi:LPXTG-motif cell wall-anchored protein